MTQLALFDNPQADGVPLENVAIQLDVSVASVRNWIKTGYLNQTSRGVVSQDSLDNFKNKVAGGEKLTARANKSLKDSHDHDELLNKYYSLINKDEVDGYDLGVRYEEELSNSYRNKEGVYYTPTDIVEHFFPYLPKDCTGFSFCDPCCGSGNFIVAAIEYGVSPQNIYGFDIDPIAVELTKKRIHDHTGYRSENIQCLDFLESSLKHQQQKFDIIFTNPPWGKKISKKQKDMYGRAFEAGKSIDTSSLFFFACLVRLKKDGYLGFLLQDAFFNVATFESARSKALSLKILSVIDFGKPFTGLLTKAKGILVKNLKSDDKNIVQCESPMGKHNRLQSSFQKNPKCIFNSNTSQNEADVISYLYSLPHLTLKGKARWGLGIVTGNNKKFVTDKPANGYVAVYKGADIKESGLSEATMFIPGDLSLYQQVAPRKLYQAKEKLIYKFISSKLVFFCDTKQRYILNSANLVILDKDFPISQIQLSKILGSKLMNWLFKNIFDTHKVLRSDIESLPIHAGIFQKHSVFSDDEFANYLGLEELESGSFRIKK
tara:strand:+ start:69 stop:1706 length:1638 start_codon:yes stop_codon:yes gene_type:complete